METAVPTEIIRITHSPQREHQHSKEIKEAGGVQTWTMKYDMCHKQRLRPMAPYQPQVLPSQCFFVVFFFLIQDRMYTDTKKKRGETVNLLPGESPFNHH